MEDASEVGNISDDNFTDDTETEAWDQDDLTSYRLINVTRDLQEALQDYSMSKDLRVCSDPENFVSDQLDGIEYNFDKFKGFQKNYRKLYAGITAVQARLERIFVFCSALRHIL